MTELKVFRCSKGPARHPYGIIVDAVDIDEARSIAAEEYGCPEHRIYVYDHSKYVMAPGSVG